jgi:hypothetical protein
MGHAAHVVGIGCEFGDAVDPPGNVVRPDLLGQVEHTDRPAVLGTEKIVVAGEQDAIRLGSVGEDSRVARPLADRVGDGHGVVTALVERRRGTLVGVFVHQNAVSHRQPSGPSSAVRSRRRSAMVSSPASSERRSRPRRRSPSRPNTSGWSE